MTIYFIPQSLLFLDDAIHDIPNGAVRVEKSLHQRILKEISNGKIISADENYYPVAIDPPSPLVSVLLERVKSQLRTQRTPMLDALAGIAGRESRKAARLRQEQAQALAQENEQLAPELGEQAAAAEALVAEADSLVLALLDITDDPALNAATTLQDMQAAGVAAYRAIASTASAELAVVFKEITGA